MAFNSTINTGTSPNDGQGDGLRTNMRKLIENDNFLKQEHEGLQDEFDNVFKDNLIYNVAGENKMFFKAVKIPFANSDSGASYRDKVILLIPVAQSTAAVFNRISGTIICSKGAYNQWGEFEISAQSTCITPGSKKTLASLDSLGVLLGGKLITCFYQGVEWLAIQMNYNANPYTDFWFKGFHRPAPNLDTNNDALKIVAFYDGQNNTIINSEIYNSKQDYSEVIIKESYSRLKVNETITCTSLIQTSDKKLKTNIEPIDGLWALEIFKKLSFSFYDFSLTNSKQAGLIAQEVEKILPQAVHTSENGEKGLNHTYIDMICKAAIQHFIKTQIQ